MSEKLTCDRCGQFLGGKAYHGSDECFPLPEDSKFTGPDVRLDPREQEFSDDLRNRIFGHFISEEEARRLVCAVENCRMSDVFAVLKRQTWFKDILAGVRATRHLQPSDYIKLSDSPARNVRSHLTLKT
jgi:hypothetical protein